MNKIGQKSPFLSPIQRKTVQKAWYLAKWVAGMVDKPPVLL
jgi:hypothetical protein